MKHSKLFLWIIISIGFAMQTSYIFCSKESLAHRPFEEDTFYIMTITRNIALGNGITIDGRTSTNGFQPGALVYVIPHLLSKSDLWYSLRWARLVDLILSCLAGYLLYKTSNLILKNYEKDLRFFLSLLTSALWMSSYEIFRINLNGYETVAVVCFFLLTIIAFLKRWEAEYKIMKYDFLFGFLLGLVVLSRIDMALLYVAISIVFFAMHQSPLKKKITSIFIWSAAIVVVNFAWWSYNLNLTNTIFPGSGFATRYQIEFNGYLQSTIDSIEKTLHAGEEILLLNFYGPYNSGLLFHVVRILMLTVIFYLFWDGRNIIKDHFAKINWTPIFAVVLFAATIILFYTFYFGTSWHIRRYLNPVRVAFFCFSGLLVYNLAQIIARKYSFSFEKVFYILLITFTFSSLVQFVVTYNKNDSNPFASVVEHINKKYNHYRIGAFQSGTLGYFLPNVINLDGKVNYQAYKAFEQNRLMEYIKNSGIEIICDWPELIGKYCDMNSFNEEFVEVTQIGNVTIYKKR